LELDITLSAAGTVNAKGNRITLAMLVRNETGRYLERVLGQAAQYVDNAVILDDASDDGTAAACRRILAGVPTTVTMNEVPSFHNEFVLRKQLWDLAAATGPDWILALDADEVFEDRAVKELKMFAADRTVDVYAFRLYDFWDEGHYRESAYWTAHYDYHPLMVRYIEDFPYAWKETPQRCGRLPLNVTAMVGMPTELRVKHLGWMRPVDRLAKYQRYMKLDPGERYGNLAQYHSILDREPHVVAWVEDTRFDPLASRTFVTTDPQVRHFVFPLPPIWWSRSYEYEWARRLCSRGEVVLDAGCGICHPFKFCLADLCREIHACDIDERILSPQAIRADIATVFGAEAMDRLPADIPERIAYAKASLAALPYENNKGDKIFCLSVLEHLSAEEIAPSMDEFRRVLKDDGLLILTCDCPSEILNKLRNHTIAGWSFASGVSFAPVKDAILLPNAPDDCYCFRAVLRKVD